MEPGNSAYFMGSSLSGWKLMNCKVPNLLESEVIATRDDIDLDTDHEALGTLKNELDLVTHQTL